MWFSLSCRNAILTHKAEGLCKPAIGILFPPAIFIMLSLIPVSVMGNNSNLQTSTLTAKNSMAPQWNPYPNGMHPRNAAVSFLCRILVILRPRLACP